MNSFSLGGLKKICRLSSNKIITILYKQLYIFIFYKKFSLPNYFINHCIIIVDVISPSRVHLGKKWQTKKARDGSDNFSRRDFAVQMKLHLQLSRSIVQSIVDDDWAIAADSTRKRTFCLIDCTWMHFPPGRQPETSNSRKKCISPRRRDGRGCNTLALLWKRSLPLRVKPGISRDVRLTRLRQRLTSRLFSTGPISARGLANRYRKLLYQQLAVCVSKLRGESYFRNSSIWRFQGVFDRFFFYRERKNVLQITRDR